MNLTPEYLTYLRQTLTSRFSTSELKTFCFDLGIDYDSLPGEGKEDKVRELIEHFRRRNNIGALVEAGKRLRPDIDWEMEALEPPARDQLISFFNLNQRHLAIKIFLSRHSAPARLPQILISKKAIDENPALKNIADIQHEEREEKNRLDQQNKQNKPSSFAMVSAIEMIEALHLKEAIEASFPGDTRGLPSKPTIHIAIEVCPPPKDYEKLVRENGTLIFIGGPRANIGTYYYLFGEKAGEMRPTRWPKNRVEWINQQSNPIDCKKNRNLAIIQRHIFGSKTLFYLAGTGVDGTAAAVVYLRKHWLDELSPFFKAGKSCRVIEVDRRKEDYVTWYDTKNWKETDWEIRR